MGLIINRPTDIPVSRLFEELKIAKEIKDYVYLGGPVGRTGVLALLRSKTKPEEARHVFDDVYLVSSGNALKKAVEAGTEPAAFRIYLGYAGWRAGQLEREVERGVWHILKADAGLAFDSDPDSVWLRLIRRTELRRAFMPITGRTVRKAAIPQRESGSKTDAPTC
jgi:putative transcriptional regulator